MRVVIAGGHGKIALLLTRLLTGRGDSVVGLVRNSEHCADVLGEGAQPVVFDLEAGTAAELAGHLQGADAVVFAAGAGPNSGIPRKDTVDRAGAGLLASAAEIAGVHRYLLIGSLRVDVDDPHWMPPEDVGEVFAAYLRAKAASELDLRTRVLDWTVLRPGKLTDDEPTGRVRLSPPGLERAEISRADVAAVLAALLDEPGTARMTLELVAGDTPIRAAVSAAVSG